MLDTQVILYMNRGYITVYSNYEKCCWNIKYEYNDQRLITDEAINNIAKSLEIDYLDEISHYDTINNFKKKLDNKQLEEICDYMIRELLKKRSLEEWCFNDKYWYIAIDGTQITSFDYKHCEHCLKKTHINKDTSEIERIDYFHNVLEAKLIVGNVAFSVATEFIENKN